MHRTEMRKQYTNCKIPMLKMNIFKNNICFDRKPINSAFHESLEIYLHWFASQSFKTTNKTYNN